MATGQRHDALPPETVPALTRDQAIALADTHLADLAETQRPHVARLERQGSLEARTTWTWWWLRRQSAWLGIALEATRRAYRSPRRRLGRWYAHAHVISWRASLNVGVIAALLMTLLFAVNVVWVQIGIDLFGDAEGAFGAESGPGTAAGEDESAAKNRLETISAVAAAVTGLSTAAAIALLWNDFARWPHEARKIRRRIRKRPVSILPSAPPLTRHSKRLESDDPLEGQLIPRDDLFDEILPGLLHRTTRRDVQVIIGDPGAGKTTALIGAARFLARVGMVPVFVPLRGEPVGDVLERAADAFDQQFRTHSATTADSKPLWRWLCARRRIVVLIDNLDQVGADGERGYVLRQTLDRLATRDFAVIATARPAGIPAGVAASSVDLGGLDRKSVVTYVIGEADKLPEAETSAISERELCRWIDEGQLAEIPFYLEILASLQAAGRCRALPQAATLHDEGEDSGRLRRRPDGGWQLNPAWVRFRLLEAYYEGITEGKVQAGLGLEPVERCSSLALLEEVALVDLRATAQQAADRAEAMRDRRTVAGAVPDSGRSRADLQELIDSDDRRDMDKGQRRQVSPHEAIDTGERLRILDRDNKGRLFFRHRIMQAYLAGRRLARCDKDHLPTQTWVTTVCEELLHRHNPERLTVHMTLQYAALHASDRVRRRREDAETDGAGDADVRAVAGLVALVAVRQLCSAAADQLQADPDSARGNHSADTTDPRQAGDPERRRDPDGALTDLTAALTIVHALWESRDGDAGATTSEPGANQILEAIKYADGATRWTKLNAIAAIAELRAPNRWDRLWDYARDGDYRVRRAAAEELQRDAFSAYRRLQNLVEGVLTHAAARSALNLPIATPGKRRAGAAEDRAPLRPVDDVVDLGPIEEWTDEHVRALNALGWVLPAIVSGLREDPSGERGATTPRHADAVHDARHALAALVTLAFQGGQGDLEASVAQGFKDDAMRHAQDPDRRVGGPGWVASNRRLVAEVCLEHAEGWYARMLLYQALGLYAIAGANPRDTHATFTRMLDAAHETHPFVVRAARLARRAVERKQVGSSRWDGQIWKDEGIAVAKRSTVLDDVTGQLVADVTLLLNLNERSPEDRQVQFGHMHDLPWCLTRSQDREEILGAGCPASCGWGLCPYSRPPVDEPNAHRGISRAFCRQQQELAHRSRRAPWQRHIRRRRLDRFWRGMERRARM